MGEVLLTKKIEFAAAHRYHNRNWDAVRNRAVFGACNNEHGHGHNYLLEVTVGGEVDPKTGMVVNLYDLRKVLEQVLEEFDHKHLNLDTPYFHDRIPTTENLAIVLWGIIGRYPGIGRLHAIRVHENEDLLAEVTAEIDAAAAEQARLIRRYHFSAAHHAWASHLSEPDNRRHYGQCSEPNGHNYVLAVSLRGNVSEETGMVTDVAGLDRIVREFVISRLDHRDLNRDPRFGARPTTGENVAATIWDLLHPALPAGLLERVYLAQARDLVFEYSAPALRPTASGR
jgi:6-pyruvoyltetrahydropterin/6-carboxytetrahydropterin synthase